MEIIEGIREEELREKFISVFVNKDTEWYKKIKQLFLCSDGYCYLQYLWDTLKNPKMCKKTYVERNLSKKKEFYVMWDIHSKDYIRIKNYWKFPKRSILKVTYNEFTNLKKDLPEDIYMFDDSFQWGYALTHEEFDNEIRYCLDFSLDKNFVENETVNNVIMIFPDEVKFTKHESEVQVAEKNEVISVFTKNFKARKFLKTRQTWKKNSGEVTLVCNIQNSQWCKEDYYVNVGVLINEFSHLPHIYGTVDERIDIQGTAEDVFNRVIDWFERYNSVDKLIKASKNKEFPEIDSSRILKLLKIDSVE